MNLSLKAKASLNILKIQHLEEEFESHMDMIQILIWIGFESRRRCEKVCQRIRIHQDKDQNPLRDSNL